MNQRESSEMHKAKSIEAIHIIISIISTNECASQMLKANRTEADMYQTSKTVTKALFGVAGAFPKAAGLRSSPADPKSCWSENLLV